MATYDIASELCAVCGSAALVEIKCKMICRNCGTIVRAPTSRRR